MVKSMNTYRITSLYPQYQKSEDRRKENIPVAIERRSGRDRRSADRVTLDKQLTKDLFEVKSKINKLESLAPRFFHNNVTTQSPTFGSMNNLTQDQLVKETTRPDPSEIARQEALLKDKADTSFQIGIIAAALAAGVVLSFIGTPGAVIAIGTGVYIGGRVLKTALEKELKETEKNNYKP